MEAGTLNYSSLLYYQLAFIYSYSDASRKL
jgi:hypothetical protein